MKGRYFFFWAMFLVSTKMLAQITIIPSAVSCKQKTIGQIYCLNPGRVPQFPGGDSLMQEYVVKHLILEQKLKEKAEGKIVKIQFDVDTTGKIWNVALVNEEDMAAEIKNAVVNLICNMPDWIPGGVGNKGDSEYYNVNIRVIADVYFWTSNKKVEAPAHISLMQWPKGKIRKEIPRRQDVFQFAEVMPTFPGGEGSFEKYLADNLKYPEADFQAKKQGTVWVTFTVEKDGSITDVHVTKEVPDAPGLTNEAIRLIAAMPKWTPGKMNGRNVPVMMTQPIKFVLN
jgi:TonB family protein